MNLKKIFVTLLAFSMLLSACGSKDDETIGAETTDPNAGITEVAPEEGTGTTASKITTADEAIAFITDSVYPQCPDFIPMMTETMALPLDDPDTISFHTGMTDLTGITDVILSQSGVGSIAYSLVYLRTDGSDVAGVQSTLGSSIDPAKWICVTAEYIASVTLDNDVILIMGEKTQVDNIMNAVTTAAADFYTNVGSVVTH